MTGISALTTLKKLHIDETGVCQSRYRGVVIKLIHPVSSHDLFIMAGGEDKHRHGIACFANVFSPSTGRSLYLIVV